MKTEPITADVADFAGLMEHIERRNQQLLFYALFPGEDKDRPDGSIIHARHKYAKHLEFFEAGADFRHEAHD